MGYHYDAVNDVDQLWDGMLSMQQAGYATDCANVDTQFIYARNGQVATRRKIMTVDGVATSYPTTHTYDVAGRLTAIQYLSA